MVSTGSISLHGFIAIGLIVATVFRFWANRTFVFLESPTASSRPASIV